MPFNFREASPIENHGLCGTCKNSQITEFDNGKSVVYCHELPNGHDVLKSKVNKCSMYSRVGSMTLHRMENIAYVIETKKGGEIGFKPPRDKARYNNDESY